MDDSEAAINSGDRAVNDLTDDELMTIFRDGAADAFETLFARHHGLVYNFAYTMTRDTGVAEDIMQETFIAAARAVGRYETRGHFRPWLEA